MTLSHATIVGENGKYAVSIPVFFRWANSVCFRFEVPLDEYWPTNDDGSPFLDFSIRLGIGGSPDGKWPRRNYDNHPMSFDEAQADINRCHNMAHYKEIALTFDGVLDGGRYY